LAQRRLCTFLVVLLVCGLGLSHPVRAWAQDPVSADDPVPAEPLGATPLVLQGFGDVNYVASAPDGGKSGFVNGAFDLFATSRLGDHWSALAELVFEVGEDGLATDLERFQFTYEYSDAFRVSAGRMHNPLLRWPVTTHHGVFMQTPIERPIVARWEDEPGLWPMHFVGVMAQGRFGGAVGPSYTLGLGNGRGTSLDDVQMGGDANTNRAVVATFGVSPEATPGLSVSVSGYFDTIPAPDESLKERDATVSGSYVRGDVEVRAEWSRMRHTTVESATAYDTTGWYTLIAYRLPAGAARIKPYVVVEGLNAAEGEAFLEHTPDEDAWAVGARWDANRWVALKADYRSRRIEHADRFGTMRAQLAVNF